MNLPSLTRRQLFQTSATLAAGWWLGDAAAEADSAAPAPHGLYFDLLKTWCDALVGLQINAPNDSTRHGGFSCPACGFIHGRCADAVYPLLYLAHTTGQHKYLDAAVKVQRWSDNVTQPDGSFLNEVSGSTWKGITVFATIALADALHYHGTLLDAATRARWRDRLARAAKFLDGWMKMETGNINYPVTSSLAFAVAGEVLDEQRYLDRGREFAHTSLKYFTPNHLLFGEGKPKDGETAKHCRPVDLGYNVEESLPALALYSLVTGDREVREAAVSALRAHLEFMLPDGAWDNSWGNRNYKWTWWGSRTSDGCQPAYALLAQDDPRFAEVAWRNLELFTACTHDGLLHGGPHYHQHGVPACVHHTFTHAKALATVLDRAGAANQARPARINLPRDAAYGLRSFPEVGTHLAAVGPWRATVTEYDWEYQKTGGGHASGGALTMLFHQTLGPILTASMTEYQLWEAHNQQQHGNYPTMPLTPRIELGDYTSLNDFAAALSAEQTAEGVLFAARGRLLTSKHEPPASGDVRYRLTHRLTANSVTLTASADAAGRFMLPVICPQSERIEQVDAKTLRLHKPSGVLTVASDSAFEPVPEKRVFNLVPGFECAPLAVALAPGREVSVKIQETTA